MQTHYFDQDGMFNHSDPWAEVERVQIDITWRKLLTSAQL
jgi:hypothetical protein